MPDIVDTSLRLGHGFRADERDHVVETLSRLDDPLQSFGPERTQLDIFVKERGEPTQLMTLEAKLGALPLIIATSREENFDTALNEVRDDLLRQVSDAKRRVDEHNVHRGD